MIGPQCQVPHCVIPYPLPCAGHASAVLCNLHLLRLPHGDDATRGCAPGCTCISRPVGIEGGSGCPSSAHVSTSNTWVTQVGGLRVTWAAGKGHGAYEDVDQLLGTRYGEYWGCWGCWQAAFGWREECSFILDLYVGRVVGLSVGYRCFLRGAAGELLP